MRIILTGDYAAQSKHLLVVGMQQGLVFNTQSLTKRSAYSELPQLAMLNNMQGRRLWSKFDIFVDGDYVVPRNCGGTVVFHDAQDTFTVRWDNGATTIDSRDSLLRKAFMIGTHRTLQDHMDCLANRCACKA